ncbi:MAG: hypothetical protein Q7Q73_10075 [Verrucomicrobiota bacterium JB024]|nr:hypothetical protein [Verrucomicrobiota bacterium JB024]
MRSWFTATIYRLAVDSPPLGECVRIFLSRKQQAAEKGKLSAETYMTLKQRLNNLRKTFAAKHPGITIGAVTSRQLIQFFEGLDVAERTLENYLADIGNFFNDASNPKDEHRFINKNPMDGVQVHYRKFNGLRLAKATQTQRNTPMILQLEAVKHVLRVAHAQRKRGMLGFAVCGLFAGMRPSEVFDLVAQPDYWERFIKLEEGIIRIDGFGKKRDQRTILLSDCALAWLRFLEAEKLPLCFHYNPNSNNVRYAHFRALAFLPEGDGERLIKLRRAVKGGHKPTEDENRFAKRCRKTLQTFQDVLRHTYGTHYYYACGFDKHKTIEQTGHSSEVFVEHYRGLLNSPKDAEVYFELYPAKA